jgi:hypothetical protein
MLHNPRLFFGKFIESQKFSLKIQTRYQEKQDLYNFLDITSMATEEIIFLTTR